MSTIRVLTLGWEFPPLVNGGLGIACLGLSKALAKKVDLRVIVPKADPSVLFDGFQLTGLNNVSYREVEQVDRKYSYDSFALVERAPIELDPYTTSTTPKCCCVLMESPLKLMTLPAATI